MGRIFYGGAEDGWYLLNKKGCFQHEWRQELGQVALKRVKVMGRCAPNSTRYFGMLLLILQAGTVPPASTGTGSSGASHCRIRPHTTLHLQNKYRLNDTISYISSNRAFTCEAIVSYDQPQNECSIQLINFRDEKHMPYTW